MVVAGMKWWPHPPRYINSLKKWMRKPIDHHCSSLKTARARPLYVTSAEDKKLIFCSWHDFGYAASVLPSDRALWVESGGIFFKNCKFLKVFEQIPTDDLNSEWPTIWLWIYHIFLNFTGQIIRLSYFSWKCTDSVELA